MGEKRNEVETGKSGCVFGSEHLAESLHTQGTHGTSYGIMVGLALGSAFWAVSILMWWAI
jgi:hypothetical protein